MNKHNKIITPNADFQFEKEAADHLIEEGKQQAKQTYQQGKEEAKNIYNQAKDSASELYEESVKKVSETQDKLNDYSAEFAKSIKNKPFASLLIAGGLGFILSALLKK